MIHFISFILVILAACTIASTLKCDTLANGQQVCNNLEEIKEKDIKEAEKEGIALHNMPSTPPKPTTTGIPIRSKEEQDEMDHYWISYVHAYAVEHSPAFPFGGAIVDARSNKLICIGSNQIGTGSLRWSKFHAHGEMVAMENCSLPLSSTNNDNNDNQNNNKDNKNNDKDNENDKRGGGGLVDGARGANNEEWQYMIMYGNVEACPMCAQAAIWRGLRRMVFGARAIILADKRCWTQSFLTAAEVVEKSSHWAPFEYVRGPLYDLEDSIVADFRSFCTKNE